MTESAPEWTAERVELHVRALLTAGDDAGAAATALRYHGAEVFGFLLGVLDEYLNARHAYAGICERVRREIGPSGWRCSLRTWMYAVARAELRRYVTPIDETPGRGAPELATVPEPGALPNPITTLLCQVNGMDAAIGALRQRLSPDDRVLLVLQVDRRLDFPDLALVELGDDASPAEIGREIPRLRKRLQSIRTALARAAAEQRLLPTR